MDWNGYWFVCATESQPMHAGAAFKFYFTIFLNASFVRGNSTWVPKVFDSEHCKKCA